MEEIPQQSRRVCCQFFGGRRKND